MTSSNGNLFHVTGSLCGEFTGHRPVTRSFDAFFDLRLNKWLSTQSRRWWFEAPPRPLWRQRNQTKTMGYKVFIEDNGLNVINLMASFNHFAFSITILALASHHRKAFNTRHHEYKGYKVFIYENIKYDIATFLAKREIIWLILRSVKPILGEAKHFIRYSVKRIDWGWLINSSSPGQNGRHFADDLFKCIFLNEKFCISIRISLKIVPKCSIDNKSALVQVMVWRRTGDNPSFEPMLTQKHQFQLVVKAFP